MERMLKYMSEYEKIADAIYTVVEAMAEGMKEYEDGYAVFNIGEIQQLSDLCEDMSCIVVNALNRNKQKHRGN